MNAREMLLAEFHRLAEVPDAVPRLRRFVLELAVRGMLGHSDPVGPADGRDGRWPIPRSWRWAALADLCGRDGVFVDGDWVESKDQDPNGDVRLVQLADVGVCVFRDRSSRFLTSQKAKELNCTYLAPGDVLIARMPDPLGRACTFPGDKRPCVTVVDVAVLRVPTSHHDPSYLVLAINSPSFTRTVEAKAAGTTRSRISRGNLGRLFIPVPPLAEQRRIVAKVDELMALCDRLEAAQSGHERLRDELVESATCELGEARFDTVGAGATSIVAILSRNCTADRHVEMCRRGVIDAAVRGNLVPQDPAEPSIADALKHAMRVRKGLAVEGELRAPAPQPDGVDGPFEAPLKWLWVRPDEISAPVRNALAIGPFGSSLLKADYRDEGVPLVFVADVTSRFSRPPRAFIAPAKALQLQGHVVRAGDLVIAKMGDPPGEVALYPEGRPNGVVTADCVKWTVSRECASAEFLALVLASRWGAAQILDRTKGAAHQKISLKRFRSMQLPLPPLAEQCRIVAKVQQLMGVCTQLESALCRVKSEGARLFEAVLHESVSEAS